MIYEETHSQHEESAPMRAPLLVQLLATFVAIILFAVIYDPIRASPLAFFALTPITLVFANPRIPCSYIRAGLFGYIFGLTASLTIVGPWMLSAAVEYFGQTEMWSYGFVLAVNSAYVAVFYVPTFVFVRILSHAPPLSRVFGIASIWILFEALRACDPAGNVWAQLGQPLALLPVLREAAAYGGIPLLGWLAAVTGAAIGVSLHPDISMRDALRAAQVAAASPIVMATLGSIPGYLDTYAPLQPLRVAVVQAEIPGPDVWDPKKRIANWEYYLAQTEAIRPGSADLVVWPENSVPFLLNADAAATEKLAQTAQRLGIAILLGGPRSADGKNGTASLLNSAYFFPADGGKALHYDKQRLLPYVESAPPPFDPATGDVSYVAGDSIRMFNVRGWQIAPLLCFEALYPQYSREAVLSGAHLLINLSNDAWFSGGSGPEQHYAMSIGRSVELRRSMVRASNGGISGAIAPDGSDISYPNIRAKATRVFEIPPPPRNVTWAAEHPNTGVWLSAFFAILALGTAASSIVRRNDD